MEGKRLKRTLLTALLFVCLCCSSVSAAGVRLIPSGETIGIHVDAKGLLVVGIAEVRNGAGASSPAWEAGLRIGDLIHAVGSCSVATVQELRAALEEAGEQTSLRFIRGGKEMQINVTPARDPDGVPELGLWLRSSMSGIGTMTYLDPVSGTFGALGHGVRDGDTGVLLPLLSGTVGKAAVDTVKPGEKGSPGELKGSLGLESPFGQIDRNTRWGVFGHTDAEPAGESGEAMEICPLEALRCGPACILSDVSGTLKAYTVEISRVFPANDEGRDLLLTVTDPELLALTGGIVQGMSGSPIIQEGKLAGAVTHVLVNDPARGYGIGIERMLGAAA